MNATTSGANDAPYLDDRAERREPSADPLTAPAAGSTLPIRFTASGSEYFRIWSVNLLLTLVTLGLYHPWAKVRKLRYFYGNTWVGDHAFDFHGDPKRMLRGTLLVGVMFIAYSAAGHVSPVAGLVALALVALVWPALFRASLRFRMGNTSWRGMRFHFTGDMAGAYKAFLPAMLPVVALVAIPMLMTDGADANTAAPDPSPEAGLAMGITMLAFFALLPLVMWGIKRYQHGHYALGRVQSRLRTGPGSFYGLFAKAFGVFVLVSIVGMGVPVGLMIASMSGGASPWALLPILFMVVGYIVVIGVSNTFVASRLQNLVWNRTRTSEIRFDSQLQLGPLLRLTLKNWFFVILTLGLYWPFAAVASARLKLQSVTVHTRGSVDDLAGRAGAARNSDATGDAAGDLFGLDVGL